MEKLSVMTDLANQVRASGGQDAALVQSYTDAVVAVLPSLLPFALFSTGKTPRAVSYLGKVLPPAVIAMLVVYCLKDMSFASAGSFVPQIIASAAVVLMQLWKKNTILSIVAGTAVYMILVQLVFV